MSSVATGYKTTLSSSITSTDTTIPVTSLALPDGHALVMADLGSLVYLIIEPGSTNQEIISCTGIAGSTFTGATRGLAFYGATASSVAANKKAHNAGVVIEMSNVHLVYEQFVDKDSNETVAGVKTFSSYPKIADPNTAPTANGEFAPKKYVDDTAVAGAPNATTTVKGIIELATDAELAAGTEIGGTGASVVAHGNNFTTTPTANKIPVASATGKLAAGWGGSASTLATLDGSTKVVEDPANATTIPAASKIPIAGGTGKLAEGWLQMTDTQATTLTAGDTSNASTLHKHIISTGQGTRTSVEGVGNETIAHGLGVTPKLIKIFYTANRSSSVVAITAGCGTATTINNETCTWHIHDNNSGAITNPAGQTSGQIIHTEFSNGTTGWEASLSTLDATNFVLNFGTASDHTLFYQWEAYS